MDTFRPNGTKYTSKELYRLYTQNNAEVKSMSVRCTKCKEYKHIDEMSLSGFKCSMSFCRTCMSTRSKKEQGARPTVSTWESKLQTLIHKFTKKKLKHITTESLQRIYERFDKRCILTGSPLKVHDIGFFILDKNAELHPRNFALVHKCSLRTLNSDTFEWTDAMRERIRVAQSKLDV